MIAFASTPPTSRVWPRWLLVVDVVCWSEGREAAVARTAPTDLGHVDAGPGWSLDVPFDESVFDSEGKVVGMATLVAVDGGVYVPVVLTSHLA